MTNNDVDAGMHQAASVTGFVWNDTNSNGIQDGGEPGQASVVVNVYAADGVSLVTSGATNVSGNYSITNIPAGPIVLEVAPPVGSGFTGQDVGGDDNIDSDVDTFTGRVALNIAPGSTEDVDAGLVTGVEIGDFVWEDVNGDGLQTGELGLDGIDVNLRTSGGAVILASTVTTGGGQYSFFVDPGDYLVEVVLPGAGYTYSPQDVGADDTVDSDVDTTNGRVLVTVLAATPDLTIDAGLVPRVTVTGFVWEDLNTIGIQDGEGGRDGVTVNLLDPNTLAVAFTDTTAGGGNYSFIDIPSGNYILQVIPPAGFSFSPQDVGFADDSIDSDVDAITGELAISLPPGSVVDYDAGLVPAFTIGDFVWNDINGNGLQDGGGEVGIANVTVNLLDTMSTVLDTTVTDGAGAYSFTVVAGTYVVEVQLPVGFSYTLQDVGGDDTIDSDVDTVNGQVGVVVTTTDNDTVDAGLIGEPGVGDFVWNDLNANGVQDGGEPGIAGVQVELLDNAGAPLVPAMVTVTDANGIYSFLGITAGDYIVEFTTPAGFSSTQQDAGGDDALDSDITGFSSAATLQTPVFTVTTIAPNIDMDAGYISSTSVGDFVWEDVNGNGIQDAGEPGLENVDVDLTWAGPDDTLGNGDDVSFPTIQTDVNGNYTFANLPDGTYEAQFTALGGYSFTVQDAGADDAVDSDADATGLTAPFVIAAGVPDDTIDAGMFLPATLEGFVWDDANGDGIQDTPAPETGLAGIDVDLYDALDNLVASTTTVGVLNPNYTFNNVTPGDYYLEFTLPAGFVFSPQDVTPTLDSDVDPLTGQTAIFNIPSDSTTTGIDAGMFLGQTIGDFVWVDLDSNGIQNVGEPGWNGLTVNLLDDTGAPLVPPRTTVTAGGGFYSFSVPVDDYIVEFVLPGNFIFTTQDAGNDALDSDADETTGQAPVAAGAGINDTIDAGIIQTNLQALSITKNSVALSPLPLEQGDSVGWIICVFNPNAASATNVNMTDAINTATQTLVTNSIEFGVGTACPTTTPIAGDYDVSGPTPVADTNNISVTIPTLNAMEYGILYFEVTLNDPGLAVPDSSTTTGVVGMSTLFLALGGLLTMNKRKRWLGVLVLVAILMIMLAPGLLYAQNNSDNAPSVNQDTNGQWVRYEVGDPGVVLSGFWEGVESPLASASQYLLSDDPNAAVDLSFSGSKVRVHYVSLWDSAVASVVVDGQLLTTLDDYSADSTTQVLVTDEFVLSEGEHQLTIQSTGASHNLDVTIPVVALDAIDVWVSDSGDGDGGGGGGQEGDNSLNGIVWSDLDGDGKLGASDRVLSDVTVFLYRDNGDDDTLITSENTNADGQFVFNVNSEDEYWVVVHRETLPTDVDHRSVNWSPVNVTTFDDIITIPPVASDRVQNNITGTAWLDNDHNSLVSGLDSTLANVPIMLYADDGDRIFDPSEFGDFVIDSQFSDANGEYGFGGLLPGIYWIVVDTDNLPEAADTEQTASLLWVRVPRTSIVDLLLIPAPEMLNMSGQTWLDVDHNSELSSDDIPLAGVTVTLYEDNGNGFFEDDGSDILVGSELSVADGEFNFSQLSEGVYWVLPDTSSLPNGALADQAIDAQWVHVPVTNLTHILLIPGATSDVDYPTGPATIVGHVFNDDNGNREWDDSIESGIRDVQVALYYDNGDGEFNSLADYEVEIAQVNDQGRYEFAGLGEGLFWVYLNESTLPANYMDTVAYGEHGLQVYQAYEVAGIDTTATDAIELDGPLFAYALDTDQDGSPDGREGSGDRDNDNIANYQDPFDPTGLVYAVDPFGEPLALTNVEVSLVYVEDGEFVLADTIQPNPQRTGADGQYRFDITTNSEGKGYDLDGGERVYQVIVGALPETHEFPSAVYEPAEVFVGSAANGQVVPFNELPTVESAHDYHLDLQLDRSDDDVVNNHIPIDMSVPINAGVDNQACVLWAESTTGQVCDTDTVVLSSDVDFTLVAEVPANATLQPGQSTTYDHTLTNIGNQSDSYRIEFPGGDQLWTQTLTIIDGTSLTTLSTLSPGQSFTAPPIAPGETLLLEHDITVPISALHGTVDTTVITAVSTEAETATPPVVLENSSQNQTTVEAGCVTGFVYNDLNSNLIPDLGEGVANVRIFVLQGVTPIGEVLTDATGSYQASLAPGTYTLDIDETTLPAGATVIDPVGGTLSVTVTTVGTTCQTGNFRLQVTANPSGAITKSANVASAAVGDTITYTIVVSNTDPTSSAPFTNVVVTDPLSGFLTFVSASASQGTFAYNAATNTVTFTIGTIPPSVTVTLTINATVNDTVVPPTTISNSATFTATDAESVTVGPVVIEIPSSDGDGDGGGDGDEGGGGIADFGTGGGDDTATEDGGPDTLPQTGYRPIDWQPSTPDTAAQTAKLSASGRVVMIVLGVFSILLGLGLYYVYNNSEALYQWFDKRSDWFNRTFMSIIVLLFVFGVLGVVYTFNDIAGVVDVDKMVGWDVDAPVDDGVNDQQVAINNDDTVADDTVTDSDDNIGGANSLPTETNSDLPTVSLPRPDANTRRVIIPSLNLFTKLVESPRQGTTWDISDFTDEVAHLEGTAAPGISGNTVLAGHVTHERGIGPFHSLHTVAPGAIVIVKEYDVEYTYVVREIFEVAPSAIEVTHDTDDAMLTLISCANWDPQRQVYNKRIIVRASLERWQITSGSEASSSDLNALGEQTRYEVGQAEDVSMEGDWEELASYHTSEGSYFYSDDKDAEINLLFQGDKFRLNYVMFENFGIFDVYLDGKLVMTIDGYSEVSGIVTTEIFQVYNGRHTLRIVNTGEANPESKGNVIGLDAIDVWR